MSTLASRIQTANQVLNVDGDLDAVREFFTSDYVAHPDGSYEIRSFAVDEDTPWSSTGTESAT